MADRREWIARIKAEAPPDLWSDVIERASQAPVRVRERVWDERQGPPRRAAFVTGAAAGILALALVVVGLRGAPPGDEPPAPTPLDAVHDRLERALSDLWIAESNQFLLRGEVQAAEDELTRIIKDAGASPTDAEQARIEAAQQHVDANVASLQAASAQVGQLRPEVERLREVRAGLLPPPDEATYPDLATVRCDGDGEGGTHVSTPVARARSDGAHIRVVNGLGTERAFLVVDDEVVHELPPATTADVVLPSRPSGDAQIACTYDEPPFNFPRPTHPLWIVAAEDGVVSGSPSPSVTMLDPFLATASLDEPPVAWTEVAAIPAGEAESEIGIQPCFHCGDQQVPTAIAVDGEGSFWVADRFKHRVAHFDRDGSFLEAFPVSAGPADVTIVDGRLYALLTEGGSNIAALQPGGFAEPITVNHEGRRLHVQALIGGQDELLVLVSGAQRLLGGYWAFATVDPETGQVTPSAGLPYIGGSTIDLAPLLDDPPGNYQVRWFRAGTLTSTQDVRFQLVLGGHELRTTSGDTYLRISTRRGVATIVGLSDVRGIAGGLWYLEILPESPSIVLERIAEEGLVGTANNRRYLTVGPDGEVYLMRLFENEVRIYRR